MLKFFLTLALVAGAWAQEEISDNTSNSHKIRPPPKLRCLKKNEELDLCPTFCPARTCGIDDSLIDCNPNVDVCPPPRCRCKAGFFRDDKGNCVRWEQCPKCTRPNEKYDPCDNPCGTRRCDYDPTVAKCAFGFIQLGDKACIPRCRCDEGFLANAEGVCISRLECPCGGDPNAQFGCGGFCQRCSNREYPVACKFPCQIGACDCREGYIYDDVTEKCVLPENCTDTNEPKGEDCETAENNLTSCEGDPNAQRGCGGYCTRCSNYKTKKVVCANACDANGCDCKKGYIYDDIALKCVLPKDCIKADEE